MASKIKIVTLLAFTVCFLSLTGCKENKWMDWKVQNELWLEQNKTQPGVKVSATGLQYKIIADPTPLDARPNKTSTINCDYSLRLINGCPIDGGNSNFSLSSTVAGFAEGCCQIHNHGDIEIYVPCYLGYDSEKYSSKDEYNAEGTGTEGTSTYIPPYSTLIFTVHICDVLGNAY